MKLSPKDSCTDIPAGEKKSLQILLSTTQAVKQEQISQQRSHSFLLSVRKWLGAGPSLELEMIWSFRSFSLACLYPSLPLFLPLSASLAIFPTGWLLRGWFRMRYGGAGPEGGRLERREGRTDMAKENRKKLSQGRKTNFSVLSLFRRDSANWATGQLAGTPGI